MNNRSISLNNNNNTNTNSITTTTLSARNFLQSLHEKQSIEIELSPTNNDMMR